MRRTRFGPTTRITLAPRVGLLHESKMRKELWVSSAGYAAVAALAELAAWMLGENLPGVASLAPGSLLKVL